MPSCSELGLAEIAKELAKELRSGDRVCLEGPMGAGKTTFARELIRSLGVIQPPEGSPTFAIAHEYHSPRKEVGDIVHIDFYRIRSEEEIDEAGITAAYWEREAIVISEWLSLWGQFEKAVIEAFSAKLWRVRLDFDATCEDGSRRRVEIEHLS